MVLLIQLIKKSKYGEKPEGIEGYLLQILLTAAIPSVDPKDPWNVRDGANNLPAEATKGYIWPKSPVLSLLMQWRPQITKPSNYQKVNMGKVYYLMSWIELSFVSFKLIIFVIFFLLLNLSCFPFFSSSYLATSCKNVKGDGYTENKNKVLKERKRIN